MAHHQKAVAAAAALNSGIFTVEAVAGYQAGSLALLMDSVHNLSDEMALVFLYLAFILPLGVSRNLLRSANVFNSVGLIAVSAVLLWQVIERVLHPMPIDGAVPIIVGLAAAAAPTSTTWAMSESRWPRSAPDCHLTWPADEEGPSRHDDPRLRAPWLNGR